jgi:hypothetical protein
MSSSQSSPEDENAYRHLADSSIIGINIGLHTIGRVARNRTDRARRAMVWVHNYARMTQITADMLADDLSMPRIAIRSALSDPHSEHVEQFVRASEELRKTYEANLPTIVENTVTKSVRLAMLEGYEDRVLSLLIGPERVGKTTAFLDIFLREYMDRGVFFTVPESRNMRTFTAAWGAAMGIRVSTSKNNDQLRAQIAGAMASGIVDVVCMDEAQRTWPSDLTNSYPEKIEFERTIWDTAEINRRARAGRNSGGGVGIIKSATPQFETDLITALDRNKRWKPGQFEGRMRRTHTPDTLSRAEVRAIAAHHAPEFPAPCLDLLTSVTLASPGLLGFMSNVIGKVRFMVRHESLPLSVETIKEASQRMLKGSRTEREIKRRQKGSIQ